MEQQQQEEEEESVRNESRGCRVTVVTKQKLFAPVAKNIVIISVYISWRAGFWPSMWSAQRRRKLCSCQLSYLYCTYVADVLHVSVCCRIQGHVLCSHLHDHIPTELRIIKSLHK